MWTSSHLVRVTARFDSVLELSAASRATIPVASRMSVGAQDGGHGLVLRAAVFPCKEDLRVQLPTGPYAEIAQTVEHRIETPGALVRLQLSGTS